MNVSRGDTATIAKQVSAVDVAVNMIVSGYRGFGKMSAITLFSGTDLCPRANGRTWLGVSQESEYVGPVRRNSK
jgi:hypothetical protein